MKKENEKTSEEVTKEIAEILKKNNCVISVNLLPANAFTRLFRRFLKINHIINIIKKDAIFSSNKR